MIGFIDRVVRIGTDEISKESSYIRGTNTLTLIVIACSLPYAVVYAFLGVYAGTLLISGAVSAIALTPLFNHFRFYRFAKIYLVKLGYIYVTCLALFLGGKATGFELFFLIPPLIGISIFSKQESKFVFWGCLELLVFFPMVQVLYPFFTPWLADFPVLCQFLYYASVGTTALCLGGFLYYFRVANISLAEKLENEHKRSEELLHNILPGSVVKRLKKNPTTIADGFSEATILFADIVGFTVVSEQVSPSELVDMLNKIFSRFDFQLDQYGLEKIKTIGDAYMVAGGLPVPRDDHAEATADMALAMRRELELFNQESGRDLQIRVGIHSGAAVAGVIGVKKFVYDVWGDTVNTASRMESHGIPGQIQVSEQTYRLLKDKYRFENRGPLQVKGKGEMQTFLLQGKLD